MVEGFAVFAAVHVGMGSGLYGILLFVRSSGRLVEMWVDGEGGLVGVYYLIIWFFLLGSMVRD